MKITTAEFIISNSEVAKCPQEFLPEYAFIGRSNVGKSSLINMLTGQKGLAKISSSPGKTQLINHFEVFSDKKKWYLVDLPGYGYATVSQRSRNNWQNMIESYIRKRENLVCLFVLIDSRHEPQVKDIEFLRELGEWQTPFVVVFTKIDKNKPGATKRNVEMFKTALSKEWEEMPPYFLTSAIKKTGRPELLEYIKGLNSSFTKL